MSGQAIKTVAVVGGGTAGWMAAAVLAKAFAPNVEITLVESDEIGIVGVGEATIPQIRHINTFLGFDEDDFVKNTQASFKLGIEFVDWRRPGARYIHAFGDIGLPLGLSPFHHYWLRARAQGRAKSLWAYSINAEAARLNRFARLERVGASPLGGVKHAFHFDAALYARYLRAWAQARGVTRVEGRVVDVALNGESGFIETLTLADGRTVSADFFIDCSGFRGLLIEGALKAGYEDWTHWLPCDRAVAVPCAHGGPLRPYTQAIAQPVGWRWRIPLQHRVGNGYVYCSRFVDDDAARAVLLEGLEGAPLAEPRVIRFTTGMRRKLWVKNCVAFGLASGFLEPLESTSIHLIQSGVSRLVSLFPDKACDPSLADEYNRQTRFELERIRDFLILHYHANEREDSTFWTACREMSVPQELADKMALFAKTGRIFREHEELFTEPGWLQVLLGQGVMPESWHPLADTLPAERLDGFLSDISTLVARAASELPSHADFIARHCAAPDEAA